MTYEEIRFAWNAKADDKKLWNSLTESEKIEWAASIGAEKERGPAPIFHQEAQKNLEHLQRNGFNVVGYALEHCNDWQDNRRCTVDYNGLVRWIPSADQEVAVERAARQAAQEEVVFLKERIARAGVEQRRAVREAVLEEREAFEKWLRVKPCGAAHDFAWEAWRTRAALAATQPTAQGVELAHCKGDKWLTVVYRDIQPGDEAHAIGEHPKVTAMSWSHALHDRDAALAAQAKQKD